MDRLLLVLTLAVAPALLFPLKIHFPLVAVAVPLLWLVRWPISGRLLPATPLNLPLAILGLSVLASVFSTPDLYSSLNKIAGTVFGFMLFFGCRIPEERKAYSDGGTRVCGHRRHCLHFSA